MTTDPKGMIGAEHIGIGSALSRNRLIVPVNQRAYAWEEKHVLDLFQDLTKAITSGKSTYFLGTIVLTMGKDDTWEVADGQQRLATTTILLAAIRDYFYSRPEEELLVRHIENSFLFTIDPDQRQIVSRLTLNVQDNEFFRKLILSKPSAPLDGNSPPLPRQHKRPRPACLHKN